MAPAQSTRWVFTLNNYTADEFTLLSLLWEQGKCVYIVFGRETAPETGTRHLQGFVIFARRFRAQPAKLELGVPRIHIEVARGTSKQASDYCKKEGDYIELGTCPGTPGKQTQSDAFFKWADEFIEEHGRTPSFAEVSQSHPAILLRHKHALSIVQARAPKPQLVTDPVPKEWQSQLETRLAADADDRTVDFYVDKDGGKGKTWFQQYLCCKWPERVQLLAPGKREDIAHTIDINKNIFLINVPRQGMEFLNYTILEQIKDRMIFSPKYDSVMKILLSKAHVVVFCNEDPDFTKMTFDRYNVITM